jgi:hypothetical protein
VAISASRPASIGELVRTDTDVGRWPAIHTMALLAAERQHVRVVPFPGA